MSFSELKGKIVLIENTASLWGTTVRDFTQLNDLCEKYGDKLVSNNSDLISKLFIEVLEYNYISLICNYNWNFLLIAGCLMLPMQPVWSSRKLQWWWNHERPTSCAAWKRVWTKRHHVWQGKSTNVASLMILW